MAERMIGREPNLQYIKTLLWHKCEKMLSQGLLHLDLHAYNVMLDLKPNGEVLDLFIIDWGKTRRVPNYIGQQLISETTYFVDSIWNKLISGH